MPDDSTEENPVVSDAPPQAAVSPLPREAAASAEVAAPDSEADSEAEPEAESSEAEPADDEGASAAAAVEPHELKRIHPAPAHIALDRVDDDATFRVRDEGDVAALAMDIARLGQIFPVDLRLRPPDRFQVITGFRRVSALRFLQREKVLARLHVNLSDDDAALIALAEAIHSEPVSREELQAARERFESQGRRLSAAARDMLDKALSDDGGLAPEEAPQEEEVDADELASDVATRLGQINQDLSLLADVFAELDEERRETLLEQLRYSSQLVSFLEGGGDE